MWLQPGQRQKAKPQLRELVGTTATIPIHERRWMTLSHQNKILPRTIFRRKWSISSAILAQASVQGFLLLLFFCILVRRRAMPRKGWLVASHSRAAASGSEVASRQGSDAHAAEAQCECCASTGCFDASAVEVTGSPEEIPSRGPRSCVNQDPSNPGRDRQPRNGRHRGEVQFGSRVVSGPNVSL